MVEEKLMKVVNEAIAGLSEGKRRRFEKELEDCLYDKGWCGIHNINYSNPDVGLAREKLCTELYIDKSRVLS